MGCVAVIISIILLSIVIGIVDKHPNVALGLFLLFIGTWIAGGICVYRTKRRQKQAREEAEALLEKIEKELGLPYSTPFIFTDAELELATILQVYEKKKMFGILRYNIDNNSANYMVYHYHELDDWETDIQQTEVFGRPHKISSICILLRINSQELRLTIHTGCELNVADSQEQLRTMRNLERQLSYIKPSA